MWLEGKKTLEGSHTQNKKTDLFHRRPSSGNFKDLKMATPVQQFEKVNDAFNGIQRGILYLLQECSVLG